MSDATAKAILEYTHDGVEPPYREDIVRLALDYLDLQAMVGKLKEEAGYRRSVIISLEEKIGEMQDFLVSKGLFEEWTNEEIEKNGGDR